MDHTTHTNPSMVYNSPAMVVQGWQGLQETIYPIYMPLIAIAIIRVVVIKVVAIMFTIAAMLHY